MSRNNQRATYYFLAGKSWAMQALFDKKYGLDVIRATAQGYVDAPDRETRQFGKGAMAACADYERAMSDEPGEGNGDDE